MSEEAGSLTEASVAVPDGGSAVDAALNLTAADSGKLLAHGVATSMILEL